MFHSVINNQTFTLVRVIKFYDKNCMSLLFRKMSSSWKYWRHNLVIYIIDVSGTMGALLLDQ